MNFSSRNHESKNGEYEARKEINVAQCIVEWETHQCLWNETSEEYKDKNLRRLLKIRRTHFR